MELKRRNIVEEKGELDLMPINSNGLIIRSIATATATATAIDGHGDDDDDDDDDSASASASSSMSIYLGTQSGNLLLIECKFSISNNDYSLSITRSISVSDSSSSSSSSSSSVEWIHVLDDTGRVLMLSGGVLYISDSKLLHPVKKLSLLKGIHLVARRHCSPHFQAHSSSADDDPKTTNNHRHTFLQRLGSGIIRPNKQSSHNQQQQQQGHSSADPHPKTTFIFSVLAAKKLLLIELLLPNSSSNTFPTNNVDTLEAGSFVVLKEFQCPDAAAIQTMVWLDDSIFLGTSTGYTLMSCVTGQTGLIFSLPDPSTLPTLKLLIKDYKVLLMVDNVGITVDAHGQPVGGSVVFLHAPESFAEISSSYLVAVRDGKMQLYHKKLGTCVQSLSFTAQGVGKCFVSDDHCGKGALLAVATPFKVICYKKVPYEEQMKDLLRKKNFKEAISLAEELESDGEMSKEMLSFVHAQVGFLLLFDLHFEEAVHHFLRSETMQPSELFPFIMRDPNRWSLLVPRNRYWGLHPPPLPLEDVVDDGLLAIQRAIFLRKAGVETAVDNNFINNPPGRAELLESAIRNITRYLEVSRGKDLAFPVKEGVDTLLMYLYRALNRIDDMEKLASSENSCIVEELETLLDDSGHLRTLAFLYASKGRLPKALAIWRLLAKNYSSGLWKDPGINQSYDNGGNAISSMETAAIEASKILEESSDQELVLQHIGWIADINQLIAVQILTSERREIMLLPDEVVAAIDPKTVEILQRYLQWLIEDQDSTDTRFHTLYSLSLAKSAIETFRYDNGEVVEEINKSDASRSSIFDSPVRERLQIFLESSDLYDPEEVLYLIEESELWLEKAILYRKLGQETLVLQILALKLENSEAAEQYCAEIGRPDAYMQLLDMYLDPQDGKEPMFKAAVRLLHNHGVSLDPLQVLEKLSPDMPLQLASETILRMLRARLHHHLQGQIVRNVSRAVDTDARLGRLEERQRHVQINDESTCDSCHGRLGTKLFAMYPDDTVVCYKCFRRQGETTSVTGRNFKEEVMIKPGWLVTG